MKCPVCHTPNTKPVILLGNLDAEQCATCGGHWIAGTRYWSWALTPNPPAPPAEPAAPIEAPQESSTPKFCPQCAKFLRRCEVGRGLDFHVDHCATCGGFWLDANEFDHLVSHALHNKLHLIVSPDWQADLAGEKRAAAHANLLLAHLGPADLAELRRIKTWLDAHPRRPELLAYLLEDRAEK